MRRITLAVVSTIAALVLLFSYRTSTSGVAGGSSAAPPGIVGPALPGAAPETGAAGTPQPSGATSAPAPTKATAVNATVNGTMEDNGFGPVQVQVKISGGKIVDVTTLAMPGDGRSQRINSYALPQLHEEVLSAQSAKVDTVSGATATSEAYTRSLQAALDAAHFGS